MGAASLEAAPTLPLNGSPMTSRERIDEVTAMTSAFHDAWCVPQGKPGATWSDGHMPTDRRVAARMVENLHAAGRVISAPEVRGVLLSDDVIAGAA